MKKSLFKKLFTFLYIFLYIFTPFASSVNASPHDSHVTSTVYTVTTTGSTGTITNVPFNTSKANFLSNIQKADSRETYNLSNLSDPVVTGNALEVTSGNGQNTTTYTITVNPDTTKPISTITGRDIVSSNPYTFGTWINKHVEIAISCEDLESGCKITYYSLNNGSTWNTYTTSFTISNTGTTTILYYSEDNAENVEEVRNVTVRIDKTKPSTSHTFSSGGLSNGYYRGPATITLTATDTQSGVYKTYYSYDDILFSEYSSPIAFTTSGEFNFYYYSVDNAGNVEDTKTHTFKLDAVNPVISITKTPSNPTKSVNFTYEGNISDDYSGIWKFEYDLNGSNVWNSADFDINTGDFVFNPSITSDGNYLIRFKVTDYAGRYTLYTGSYTVVDDTPPTITLNGNDVIVEKGDQFTDPGATAYDTIDGDLTDQIITTGTVNSNEVNIYFITYSVTDRAGNTTTATRKVTVVDTTPPADPTFSADITDVTNSDVTVTITYSLDSVGKYFKIGEDGDTKIYSSPVVIFLNGVIYAWAADEYGNTSDAVSFTVDNIDKENPVITLLGNTVVSLLLGDTYTDDGATALDNRDGDITKDILINSNVNTSVVGTYVITYDVSDTAGNMAEQVSRIVIVNPLPIVEQETTTQTETTTQIPEVVLAVVTTTEQPTTTVRDTSISTPEILDTDVLSEDTQDEDDTQEQDTQKEEVKGTEDEQEDSKPNRLPLYIVLGISFGIVLYLMFRKRKENSSY